MRGAKTDRIDLALDKALSERRLIVRPKRKFFRRTDSFDDEGTPPSLTTVSVTTVSVNHACLDDGSAKHPWFDLFDRHIEMIERHNRFIAASKEQTLG